MDASLALRETSTLMTPVGVVDVDVMTRNVAQMQAAVSARPDVALRPMAKTHKSACVGRKQLEAGSIGLTVATLHEAEIMAGAGATDLLLANPPVGAEKLRRLEQLRDRVERIAVTVDSSLAVRALPQGVAFLWEIDCGHHRMGTPPAATAVAVQQALEDVPRARFRGLMTFPGQAYSARSSDDLRRIADEEWAAIMEPAEELRGLGITVETISVGSSPTVRYSLAKPGITEVRPGSYVYGDAQQVTLGAQTLADCALGVVATVISCPGPGRAVIDAGSKSVAPDVAVPNLAGVALVAGYPSLVVARMSEEQGVVTGTDAGQPTGLAIGQRVVVLPAHCCTTTNLHSRLLFVSTAGSRWDEVAARDWAE